MAKEKKEEEVVRPKETKGPAEVATPVDPQAREALGLD